jgi:hypothetical protein
MDGSPSSRRDSTEYPLRDEETALESPSRPPYTPLSPTILPLPVKAYIHFREPMRFEGASNDEDEVIGKKVRQVEKAVAGLIAKGLKQRRSVFFG